MAIPVTIEVTHASLSQSPALACARRSSEHARSTGRELAVSVRRVLVAGVVAGVSRGYQFVAGPRGPSGAGGERTRAVCGQRRRNAAQLLPTDALNGDTTPVSGPALTAAAAAAGRLFQGRD